MSSHEPGRPTAGIPLQAHVQELRGRAAATARLQGGATDYWQEIRLFKEYAAEHQLGLRGHPAEIANRQPDEECNEHQVWFIRDLSWVMKVTWPDFFGLLVLYRPDEEERASPIAYLERWHLHNQLFGDSVTFSGVVVDGNHPRMVIEQRPIVGQPATLEQIREFFMSHGWLPFTVGGEIAYFDRVRNVVISDTHRANLIRMEDGLPAPIDLRVQPVSGALLDFVVEACRW
jgi:hypothetical protein